MGMYGLMPGSPRFASGPMLLTALAIAAPLGERYADNRVRYRYKITTPAMGMRVSSTQLMGFVVLQLPRLSSKAWNLFVLTRRRPYWNSTFFGSSSSNLDSPNPLSL